MNSIIGIIHTDNKQRHWFLLVLVVMLLFLPLAQATHLVEHDNLPNDIHCQICHSSINIDDNGLVNHISIPSNNPLLDACIHWLAPDYQANQNIGGHIRAPPVSDYLY